MSADVLVHLHGLAVLACGPDGPALDGERAALDLIGEAYGQHADVVAVPVRRLPDDFFTLRTGLAGALVQKFVNYQLRLAVVGDITAHVARSDALRDFVREANRGVQVWFVPSMGDLTQRLARQADPGPAGSPGR
jgi:hypothetical protein